MTAQISDWLEFDGRRFALNCEPLYGWLVRRKNRGMRFKRINTACSRGYVAAWEICRGRMYLSSVAGNWADGTLITPESLFAHYSSQYLDSVGANSPANAGSGKFAFWVTGALSCAVGRLVRYEHFGYASTHQATLCLYLDRGFLVGTRIIHNTCASPAEIDDFDIDADMGIEADFDENR